MTFKEEVTKLVKEWTKRLRVEDWSIELCFPDGDIGSFALTECAPAYQAARITFRDPKHHPEQINSAAIFDHEVTVVHELLHVRTANIPINAHNALSGDNMWEAALELTAQALVAAKRGKVRL